VANADWVGIVHDRTVSGQFNTLRIFTPCTDFYAMHRYAMHEERFTRVPHNLDDEGGTPKGASLKNCPTIPTIRGRASLRGETP
jgi:hypothetical protein